MQNKKISTTVILFLTFSLLGVAIVSMTKARPSLPDYKAVDINSDLAGVVSMPEITESVKKSGGSGAGIETFTSTPPVGTTVDDWYIEAISGDPSMTLRAISGYVEVWTQDDMSFLAGDPRNLEPWDFEVNDDMCQYLADEFNNVIYPTCASFFGEPHDRDGTGTIFELFGFPPSYWDWIDTDNPQRVILKILNYRDTNYYDPTYPYYVAGFYSSTYTGYYNRNMIHLDPWEFWKRLGPAGTSWLPAHPDLVVAEEKAHQYEGTTAHEFQHLIHGDLLPGDALFMNEGCSMFSEFLCGYGVPWGDINSYLATPDNSLTEWGDQGGINTLADYGQAALWTIYLSDRYGPDFLSSYMAAGILGINGLNAALYPDTFDEVYRDWTIANLIHTDKPGHGKYNYKSLDLSMANPPARVYEMPGLPVPETYGTDFGNTITILNYDTGISLIGPYGSDYIEFTKWPAGHSKKKKTINFDGEDFFLQAENHWSMWPGLGWYSGSGPDFYDVLAAEAYVDPDDPSLTITTYWDIEDYWDFGFIQVSTDNGVTWTSLANEYTTDIHDPGAIYLVSKNMPGLTSWSGFITPDGWVTMDFDLTDYADQNVLIGFKYATDSYVDFFGWLISEASVSGSSLDLAPWTTLGVNFQVTLIWKLGGSKHTQYIIRDMILNEFNDGSIKVPVSKHHTMYMIVSPLMETGFVDYSFWT